MFKRLTKLFSGSNEDKKTIKNYDDAVQDMPDHTYKRQGVSSIPTHKIVGSVNRAHELDGNFNYRKRAVTGRYTDVDQRMRDGRPSQPIKVVRVKRERRDTEYYVLDGHHRVANAKRNHYDEINADVTDVTPASNDDAAE